MKWLHHFAASIPNGVSPTNRHLLIFYGHGSHVALGTIQEARSLRIDLLTLPAHTSNRLQPLDVPFKSYFKEERRKWITEKHRIDIKRAELAELGSKAFKKALTSENIKSSFERTGIWPLNSNALNEDMGPSKTFDTSFQDEVGATENMLQLAGVGLEIGEDVEMVPNTQLGQELEVQHIGIDLNDNIDKQSTSPIERSQFEEPLTMPTQASPPDWMKEAAFNL
ncbi:hypothetical protein KI387_044733, partial [Taxus chinensis]